jgi:GNAT superfamily N-acetyltransferase
MWYKIAHPDFKDVDPEDNWEEADEADQIFRQNKIRYDSTKNIQQVAIENGVVIGAMASGWSKNSDYDEDVMVFSFDIVVKPEFQRQGVGLKLIQDAIKRYNAEKNDYQEMGNKTMIRLWVVNPVLIPVLERFGFQAESEPYENGSVHLISY